MYQSLIQAAAHTHFIILIESAASRLILEAEIAKLPVLANIHLWISKSARDFATRLERESLHGILDRIESPRAIAGSRVGVCLDMNVFCENSDMGADSATLQDVDDLLGYAAAAGCILFVVPEVRIETRRVDATDRQMDDVILRYGVREYVAGDWQGGVLADAIINFSGTAVKQSGDLIMLGQVGSILDGPEFDSVIFLSSDVRFRNIGAVMQVNGRKRMYFVSPQLVKKNGQTPAEAFGDMMY